MSVLITAYNNTHWLLDYKHDVTARTAASRYVALHEGNAKKPLDFAHPTRSHPS